MRGSGPSTRAMRQVVSLNYEWEPSVAFMEMYTSKQTHPFSYDVRTCRHHQQVSLVWQNVLCVHSCKWWTVCTVASKIVLSCWKILAYIINFGGYKAPESILKWKALALTLCIQNSSLISFTYHFSKYRIANHLLVVIRVF